MKYFVYYDSDPRNVGNLLYGPHYHYDVQVCGGKNFYHSLDQLLRTTLSESVKKRLQGAKIGTCIKLHYYHSCGNLMVKCVSEETVKLLEEAVSVQATIVMARHNLGILENNLKELGEQILL